MISIDWFTYPILCFASAPDDIQIHLIYRPESPFLGAGEAAQGPTAMAIGNVIANATGIRLRYLPLIRERIKAAMVSSPGHGSILEFLSLGPHHSHVAGDATHVQCET
jgi:CO/xanthine dehydrogenase Mo-binding subunit